MSIQYGVSFAWFVICSCGELGPTGELWGTEAGARTSACDAAKAEGWKVTGNSAVCPECYRANNCADCGKPNAECECDPTPYETPNDPDPGDTLRDSLVDAMRYRRYFQKVAGGT